jgi:hypothetical protein
MLLLNEGQTWNMATKCDYSSVAHTVSSAANEIKMETLQLLYDSCTYYVKIHTNIPQLFLLYSESALTEEPW